MATVKLPSTEVRNPENRITVTQVVRLKTLHPKHAAPAFSPITMNKVFSKYFATLQHSDMTIVIHGTAIPAHAVILCSQSTYFTKALNDGFREGDERSIKFDSGSACAHYRVLTYFYSGSYTDSCLTGKFENWTDDSIMARHIEVYQLADMFAIPNLKTIASTNLWNLLQRGVSIEDLLAGLQAIYVRDIPVPDTIVEGVLEVISDNLKLLWGNPSFVSLVKSIQKLSNDLLTVTVDNYLALEDNPTKPASTEATQGVGFGSVSTPPPTRVFGFGTPVVQPQTTRSGFSFGSPG
ncbi:hypothetical protein FQN57_002326 [Myotisia sp. PD_48]|nr:hypothetical protein FQN57_002326 [Myotisia sp. PD_48]